VQHRSSKPAYGKRQQQELGPAAAQQSSASIQQGSTPHSVTPLHWFTNLKRLKHYEASEKQYN
jgi:hypothetical protein